MQFTQLDIYKIIFMLELIVAETLFVHRFSKASHFVWRVIFSVVVCVTVSVFFPVFAYDAIYSSVMFSVLFAITLFFIKFCFAERWFDVFFSGIGAYTVQHLAYEVYNYIGSVSGLNELFANQIYSDAPFAGINGILIVLYMGVYMFIYWLMYVIFADRVKGGGQILQGWSMLLLAALIILVDVVLNAVAVYQSYDNWNIVYITIIFLYNIICCLLALVTQFGLLSRKNLKDELISVNELRNKEQRQYMLSRKNIDLVNRKCHDMKYLIRNLGRNGMLAEEAINEMEQAISVYDTSVKTGNKALDTILSEKKLFCVMNEISFTCIADGKKLEFMKDVTIYSLFGNLLDNAIEAVTPLDKNRRVVGLIVKEEHGLVMISCYNYFGGDVQFGEDGLPKTSKNNEEYHGFGLKSVKNTVSEYGGNLTIVVQDGVFRVNIVIPLSAAAAEPSAQPAEPQTKWELSIDKRKLCLIIIPPLIIAILVAVGLTFTVNYYQMLGML